MAQAPVTFKANSNLVIIDVSAKDKGGLAVEGLKAEDFTVLEDGKPQKVSVFEYQRISSKPEPPPELKLEDQFALPEAPKTTITAATPGQIQYHDKRLMVFFFDFSSMQIPDQLRAQDGALDYLKKNITKDDVVAVLFYASTIQVLTDFTSDRDVLTRVIKGMPIGEASELAALADTGDENGEDTQAAFVADETEFNIFSTDKKLAAIEQAAKMLASFPEKKALVYFSGGVSRSGLDNEAQLQAAINAAAKANLSIYSIDTRGLQAEPPGGGASKGGSRGSGIFNGGVQNSQRSAQLASQDTLYTLAAETGGKSFFDSNDIALGIQRTQDAMGSYYLLGYYSTNNAADGKYRKISVKLNNPKLAAKLEHREGYYADKVWGKLNAQDKEQQLKEALSAGDPATDLPLSLQIDYFRVSPTAYLVPVSIKIPGSVVALAAKGGAATTQFDFAGQIQDERHAVVGNVRDNIQIKLNPAPGAACGGPGGRRGTGARPRRALRHPRPRRQTRRPGHHGEKELSVRCRLHAGAGQVSHEVRGAREHHRQDGHVRHEVHGPRPERRHQRPETQHGDLEQPAGAGHRRGGHGRALFAEGSARQSVDRGRPQSGAEHQPRLPAQSEPVREFRRVRCPSRPGQYQEPAREGQLEPVQQEIREDV